MSFLWRLQIAIKWSRNIATGPLRFRNLLRKLSLFFTLTTLIDTIDLIWLIMQRLTQSLNRTNIFCRKIYVVSCNRHNNSLVVNCRHREDHVRILVVYFPNASGVSLQIIQRDQWTKLSHHASNLIYLFRPWINLRDRTRNIQCTT